MLARPLAAVVGLVVVSTILRAAAARWLSIPWVAPDEMIYGLVGESLWAHGDLAIRSLATPYYSLVTPAVVGLPLAVGGPGHRSVAAAQALQALAMSAAAIPVFFWTRRLAGDRLGVLAAALVLLPAGLVYTGMLMTEPVFFTATTVALLAIARAVEKPTIARYGVVAAAVGLAAATRLQGLVLVPVLGAALLLDALGARSHVRLRRLGAIGGAAGVAGALVVVVLHGTGLAPTSQSLLGAYATAAEGVGWHDALTSIGWHGLGLWLTTLGVPVLATVALADAALVRGRSDAATRASIAVVLAYAIALVVQVGLFASIHTGHVAERYLLSAVPGSVVALVTWIGRGMPPCRRSTVPLIGLAVAGAALVPIAQLAAPEALHDSAGYAALALLPDHPAHLGRIVLVALVVAVSVPVLFPHALRAGVVVPVALGLAWVGTSVIGTWKIADASATQRLVTVGAGPDSWVDELGARQATLIVTPDVPWPAIPRTMFWNRSLDDVVVLDGTETPFPSSPEQVVVRTDGRVVVSGSGSSLVRRYVVASRTLTLRGELLGSHPQGFTQTAVLGAWRVDGPVRVAFSTSGLAVNGDLVGPAVVTVYGCVEGALEITMIGKSGAPVEVRVDGAPQPALTPLPGSTPTYRIGIPPGGEGTTLCTVELVPKGLAGTTRIAFQPAHPAHGDGR